MRISLNIAGFWASFCAEVGEDCSNRFFEAFHFDDNEASANELADLQASSGQLPGSSGHLRAWAAHHPSPAL